MTAQPDALRAIAAAALDATHAFDNRGPRTYLARTRLASWLDGQQTEKVKVRTSIRWLQRVASMEARAS